MVCFKYMFCTSCASRENTPTGGLDCPAHGDPYDSNNCPRHAKFMQLEDKKRPLDKKRFR